MAKKKREPFKHSGVIIKHRTMQDVQKTIEAAFSEPRQQPNWDFWRKKLLAIKDRELSMVQTEADRQLYLNRIGLVAEALSGLDALQGQLSGNGEISKSEAEALAFNGVYIGTCIAKAAFQLLQASTVDGMEQYNRGKVLAENKAEDAFKITRVELLTAMKRAYRKYPGKNQKKLCDHVADALKNEIGGERVRQLLKEHKIRKADYAEK